MRVQTETVQFKADTKLIDFVEEKVGKLDLYFDRITSAHVYLKLENSGQVKDKIAEVKLHVPGDVLIAKETTKSFEQSIDEAVGKLKRQLDKYKEKLSERH